MYFVFLCTKWDVKAKAPQMQNLYMIKNKWDKFNYFTLWFLSKNDLWNFTCKKQWSKLSEFNTFQDIIDERKVWRELLWMGCIYLFNKRLILNHVKSTLKKLKGKVQVQIYKFVCKILKFSCYQGFFPRTYKCFAISYSKSKVLLSRGGESNYLFILNT